MKRDNPKYPPWHCFTAMLCKKCGELYEADREHICRKKNSYPQKKQKVVEIPNGVLSQMEGLTEDKSTTEYSIS